MKHVFKHIIASALIVLGSTSLCAQKTTETIVVDLNGKGQFTSIQDALNSLNDTSSTIRTILVKNGVYREKLFVQKHNLIIEGEDREKTIFLASIARDEWRCEHPDDWGVATMNISAKDLTLKNLTVTNEVGFTFVPHTFTCASDTSSASHVKEARKDGHQMALRTMNGATRMRAINCHFTAYGGDTVSPWDVDNGLWYFKDCIMEGGVDFYCPRGWAWAENCTFKSWTGPAAIWHDGSKNPDSKSIFKNCLFTGYDGFTLGRYHKDAQFFLIDCTFAANMKDADIYLVPTATAPQWGRRIYYADCHKKSGKEFSWYKNNLPENIQKDNITAQWVFGDKWNPLK